MMSREKESEAEVSSDVSDTELEDEDEPPDITLSQTLSKSLDLVNFPFCEKDDVFYRFFYRDKLNEFSTYFPKKYTS